MLRHKKRPQQWNPYQKGTVPQSHTTGCLPLGSLSNYAGDGNENGKKAIALISKTTTLRFFVHFFAVVARLQRETA